MIKVLFVDDEPAVLEGLENRLRPLKKRWDMRFALGAQKALEEMARMPADVIVSDMRMPGMDGAQLLDAVRERYPHVARFILSGQTTADGAQRLMPVAHQLLTKPCDATSIERAIERVCSLQSRMEHPGVKQAIGMLRSLPALPKLYWDLLREIDRSQSSTSSIAAIVEQDVAMTARILQMANSAFFGRGRNISTVKDAISMLGVLPIRSMLVSLQLCRAMSDVCAPRGFSLEALQAHSLATAQFAMQMVKDSEQRKNAFSAGMLHDVGRMILAIGLPEQNEAVQAAVAATSDPEYVIEAKLFGCTHAEVGAHMLSLWGLPPALIDAVAFHHNPMASGESNFAAIAAVHVANVLAQEQATGKPVRDGELQLEFLNHIGVADTVAAWRRGEPIKAL
jgi:putative nucleotidyltransferase with HDIG domain